MKPIRHPLQRLRLGDSELIVTLDASTNRLLKYTETDGRRAGAPVMLDAALFSERDCVKVGRRCRTCVPVFHFVGVEKLRMKSPRFFHRMKCFEKSGAALSFEQKCKNGRKRSKLHHRVPEINRKICLQRNGKAKNANSREYLICNLVSCCKYCSRCSKLSRLGVETVRRMCFHSNMPSCEVKPLIVFVRFLRD